jgi:hypothetical protein
MAKRMSVYVRGYAPEIIKKNQTYLEEFFKTIAEPMKQRLEPFYSTPKKSSKIKPGLSKGAMKLNYNSLIPISFQMLQYVETRFNEAKKQFDKVPFGLWSLFPNASYQMSNIRIDNSTFKYMYHTAHPGEFKNRYIVPTHQKWNETINIDVLGKSIRIWSFTGSIITDGVSVGVQFQRPSRPGEIQTKEDNDEEARPKVDWKAKLRNAIAPLKQQIDQSQQTTLIFGIDGGRKNIMTIATKDPESGKASRTILPSKQYHLMLGTVNKAKKMKRLTKDVHINSTPKTTDPSIFLNHFNNTTTMVIDNQEAYFGKTYRKNKWDTFVNGPRIINSFINHTLMQAGFPLNNEKVPKKKRIKRKTYRDHGPNKQNPKSELKRNQKIRQSKRRKGILDIVDYPNSDKIPIFALGNAKFDSNMGVSDGSGSSCNQKAERVLKNKKGICVFEVSEYMTTKNCNQCHQPTNAHMRKGADGKRFKCWDTRLCYGIYQGTRNHKPRHLHRDGNAALNIRDNIIPFLV